MAENAPPSTSGGNTDGSRGMPYYEKLRRDLREALNKKRQLDREMTSIEEGIHRTESQYLEETTAGNIIKGFDNYIKGSTATSTAGAGPGTSTRRKPTISDADRIFSKSSSSFSNKQDQSTPNSAQTTPSHAPTPTSSFPGTKEANHPTPTGASNKSASNKKKKLEKDDDDDGKPTKRGKITYGRD